MNTNGRNRADRNVPDAIDQRTTAYVLGELTPEERAAFEIQLSQDAELMQQVESTTVFVEQLHLALSDQGNAGSASEISSATDVASTSGNVTTPNVTAYRTGAWATLVITACVALCAVFMLPLLRSDAEREWRVSTDEETRSTLALVKDENAKLQQRREEQEQELSQTPASREAIDFGGSLKSQTDDSVASAVEVASPDVLEEAAVSANVSDALPAMDAVMLDVATPEVSGPQRSKAVQSSSEVSSATQQPQSWFGGSSPVQMPKSSGLAKTLPSNGPESKKIEDGLGEDYRIADDDLSFGDHENWEEGQPDGFGSSMGDAMGAGDDSIAAMGGYGASLDGLSGLGGRPCLRRHQSRRRQGR
ncbi:MAG: hypothetical protein AAFP69_04885, partial [Planctomycetota bacterium]